MHSPTLLNHLFQIIKIFHIQCQQCINWPCNNSRSNSINKHLQRTYRRQENRAMASHDQEAFLTAMQIVNSSTVHGVLSALFELSVFDIVAQKAGYNGYLHPDEIAASLPTKNPEASEMLDRMLRLLASHDIVKCKLVKDSGNALLTRAYGLTPISRYFVQGVAGPCLVPYHQFIHHREMQNCWLVRFLS